MSDVFEVLMSEMRDLNESSEFTNIIQSPLWKEKLQQYTSSDIVIPLFFYGDDFEPNNVWAPTLGN